MRQVCGIITRKDFAKAHAAALEDLSTYAHLVGGGLVQKRMLDASHQVTPPGLARLRPSPSAPASPSLPRPRQIGRAPSPSLSPG